MNKYPRLTKLAKPLVPLIMMAVVSAGAQAAVTLNVDDHIKVTAINGQAVNTSLLMDPKKTYTLEPGQHVITAKYMRLYDLRKDEHDYLRSGNITVSVNLKDNQAYRLTMPNQPEAYREAKQFAKSPTLAVMYGSEIIASQSIQSSSGGLLSGLNGRLSGLFGGGNAVQANTQTIAAINQSTSSTTATAPTITTTTSQGQTVNLGSGSTLDNFMQLWLNATPEERQKIRSWVSK